MPNPPLQHYVVQNDASKDYDVVRYEGSGAGKYPVHIAVASSRTPSMATKVAALLTAESTASAGQWGIQVSEDVEAWIATLPTDESGAVTVDALTDAIPALVGSLGALVVALARQEPIASE